MSALVEEKDEAPTTIEDVSRRHYTPHQILPTLRPSFSEVLYWAKREREEESLTTAGEVSFLKWSDSNNKKDHDPLPSHPVTLAERQQAYRALKTASWLSVFYLITTDILGPYSAPWAFSVLGYVPGILVYVFFGIVTAYTGFLLWWLFVKLDSSRYPVRTYSDLGERVFSPIFRHLINILQTIQLLFNVGIIIMANAQGLSQVTQNRVCFSALCVIWTVAGMLVGQIRSLKNLSWLAHGAIWINLVTIFITMGVVANSNFNITAIIAQGLLPEDATYETSPPVMHPATVDVPFTLKVVGILQAVYSYGGAMIFIEFMAEMRRPWDFWKSLVMSQVFIFVIYAMFGIFVYTFQGQYAVNPAFQGIAPFHWQTAANSLCFVAILLAAVMYGNIGAKVLYVNVLEQFFNFPSLVSTAGRYLWVVTIIVYWAIAFVISSAVPQISNISAIVAALCIIQFSYTFPPLLFLGFHMQADAAEGDREFDPRYSGSKFTVDTWKNWSRWKRALRKNWYLKLFNLLLALAALSLAGLGTYSSIDNIITVFKGSGHATSFGCGSPVI